VKKRKRIGDMLVDAGLLSMEQVERAIEDKRRGSMKLGEFLVQQGIVKEEDIVSMLAAQLHIEQYVPDKFPIDVTLSALVPIEIAQKNQAAPLRRTAQFLMVALVDPTDINVLDAIEDAAGIEVEPVICTKAELEQLIGGLYGRTSMDGVLESLDQVEYGSDQNDTATEDIQVNSLLDMAEGAPVIRLVNWIISQAVNEGASDVHICPEKTYVQLRFRIDGKLKDIPAPPRSMFLHIISRIKILAQLDISVSRIPQDGRFTLKFGSKDINIRVSTIPTVNGENIVMRLLDMSAGIYTLGNLGMSESDRTQIEALITRPYGMILSTGPTGSGKTTSLYSILTTLNKPDVNIMTIEDPVEYRIEKVRQIQLNEKAGMTFASGLRAILRQDPDVIMVGEIRDTETASIAVQAALTGHIVLSTVHTNDSAGAITRLVDMGIEPLLIASVLLVAFAQRLLRKVCPDCAVSSIPSAESIEYWGFQNIKKPRVMNAAGCSLCKHTGYRGRTGIYEVLSIDEHIKDMILQHAPNHKIIQAAQESGKLKTLKQDAASKIIEEITTMEEAMSKVGF